LSEPVIIVQLAFFAFAALTLGAAAMVVLSKDLMHSALFLVLTFFSVAGLYVLLEAEFLAAIQVLIYVGAVAVLFLFALMLTRGVTGAGMRQSNSQIRPAAIVSLLFVGIMAPLAWVGNWQLSSLPPEPDAIPMLGQSLMTTYALPFEVMGVVLLVALVGAIILARES
jgi:NADH:ubiquinone oxidoreductase subunit 6 (subunit J)